MDTAYQSIGIKPRIFENHAKGSNVEMLYNGVSGMPVSRRSSMGNVTTNPPESQQMRGNTAVISNDKELEEFYNKDAAANDKIEEVKKHPCDIESSSIMDFIKAHKILISLIIILVIVIAVYFLVFNRNKDLKNKDEPPNKSINKGSGDNRALVNNKQEQLSTPHKDIVNNTNTDNLKAILTAAKNKKTVLFKSTGGSSNKLSPKTDTHSQPIIAQTARTKPASSDDIINIMQQSIKKGDSDDEHTDTKSTDSEKDSDSGDSTDSDDASNGDIDSSDDNDSSSDESSILDSDGSSLSDDNESSFLKKRAINRLSKSTNDDLEFSDSLSLEERRKLDDQVFASTSNRNTDDDQLSRDLGLIYDQPN